MKKTFDNGLLIGFFLGAVSFGTVIIVFLRFI